MHLAEGTLPIGQAMAWTAAAVPALIWSLRGEQGARRDTPASSIIMSGATSLLFAATLLPLPVPIVGATSHICLTPVLAQMIGIRRMIWPTFFVLLLQAIFFAHGGLTTLGINALTLGLLGPAVAVGAWALLRRLGAGNAFGFALACGIGGLSVYVADAAVLSIALSEAAAPLQTFSAVLIGFAPVQIPLAVLEAVASVGIVRLFATRRPELLSESLIGLRMASTRGASILLVSLLSTGLLGCSYEGIDETVFGETAAAAGRASTESMLDFSQGGVGFSMTILILFGLGFAAGRSWERILGKKRDAFPR